MLNIVALISNWIHQKCMLDLIYFDIFKTVCSFYFVTPLSVCQLYILRMKPSSPLFKF